MADYATIWAEALEKLATSQGITIAEAKKAMERIMEDYTTHTCDDYCHTCEGS